MTTICDKVRKEIAFIIKHVYTSTKDTNNMFHGVLGQVYCKNKQNNHLVFLKNHYLMEVINKNNSE